MDILSQFVFLNFFCGILYYRYTLLRRGLTASKKFRGISIAYNNVFKIQCERKVALL